MLPAIASLLREKEKTRKYLSKLGDLGAESKEFIFFQETCLPK